MLFQFACHYFPLSPSYKLIWILHSCGRVLSHKLSQDCCHCHFAIVKTRSFKVKQPVLGDAVSKWQLWEWALGPGQCSSHLAMLSLQMSSNILIHVFKSVHTPSRNFWEHLRANGGKLDYWLLKDNDLRHRLNFLHRQLWIKFQVKQWNQFMKNHPFDIKTHRSCRSRCWRGKVDINVLRSIA